jgi:hypothetical protein
MIPNEVVWTRVAAELVHDREMRDEIQRVIARHKKENATERKNISEVEIRKMLTISILQNNPSLTPDGASRLLEKRLRAAMKPYAGEPLSVKKSPTGRELARRERLETVRRGRENRK